MAGLFGTMGGLQNAAGGLFARGASTPMGALKGVLPPQALAQMSGFGGDKGSTSPAAPRRRGGLFGSGIGRDMDPQQIQMALLQSQAILNGDYGAAAQIAARGQQLRATRQDQEQEAQQRSRVIESMRKSGMDDTAIELALTNPEAFGTEFNTRYRTREASEGESIVTPGIGDPTSPHINTMPRHIEQGSDIMRVTPNSVERIPGMTPEEQRARALGLQPGTPQFDTFMRDDVLGPQGPTGVGLTRELEGGRNSRFYEGQDRTDRRFDEGQNRQDGRNRLNQDRQDGRNRLNQDRQDRRHVTPGAGRGSGRGGAGRAGGGAVMVNPQTGQRIRWNGTAWVPA